MSLKGYKVNGTPYKLDFSAIENLPSFFSVSASDEGKALLVDSNGEWAATELPDGLPDVSSADSGKGLLVNGSGQWEVTHLPSGGGGGYANLPAVTSADEGKILTVNENGQWVAAPLVLQQNQNGTWSHVYVGTAENSYADENGITENGSGSSGSSGGLPSVSSVDVGKVLTVNSSGQWVAAMLTLHQNSNGTWTSIDISNAEEASF